ncbi:MAG: aromatic aminobenezylarsenical efflux permease ArsG family transporter [Planctomycetota bacterium]|jgi:cytochrome c biogenesis protein CcdA
MEFAAVVAKAFGLGLGTAVSPCPMATNVAAVSYLGRNVESPRRVLLAGILYALGRTLTYVVLALLLAFGLRKGAFNFLQTGMEQLAGPVLVVVSLFLLELIQFRVSAVGSGERVQKWASDWGMLGALLLGVLFALTFCPVTAGLFFYVVFELAKAEHPQVFLAGLFGIGTGLPVVVFAALIAFSAQSVGKVFNVVRQVEWWARRIAGVLILVVGVYLSLIHCFGLTWLNVLDSGPR